MTPKAYEIPKSLVELVKSIGPIHAEAASGYCFTILLAVRDDNSPAGFVVEQRLQAKGQAASTGRGMTFKVPSTAEKNSEATFAFTESLAEALAYIRRDKSSGSESPDEG